MSLNEPFLLGSCSSQVFCHSARKTISTVADQNTSTPASTFSSYSSDHLFSNSICSHPPSCLIAPHTEHSECTHLHVHWALCFHNAGSTWGTWVLTHTHTLLQIWKPKGLIQCSSPLSGERDGQEQEDCGSQAGWGRAGTEPTCSHSSLCPAEKPIRPHLPPCCVPGSKHQVLSREMNFSKIVWHKIWFPEVIYSIPELKLQLVNW